MVFGPKVVLLYGNVSVKDILMKDELAELEKASGGRLKVVHVVGSKKDQEPIEGWDGERGWVDKDKMVKFGHKAGPDTLVFVCGVPALYNTFCGARSEPGIANGTVMMGVGDCEHGSCAARSSSATPVECIACINLG